MYRILIIICALIFLTYPAFAQNEIDHINTLWPSGYGKLALDGDTLYVNTLNGHGVERFDIADPANPIFIDREEVSGFDQIDFARRLMAKNIGDRIFLSSFANFGNTNILSNIPAQELLYNWPPWDSWPPWKLAGNYLFMAIRDSIRVFNIIDPVNPTLCEIIGVIRTPISWRTILGSTICVIFTEYYNYTIWDYYNISDPNNIYYSHSDSLPFENAPGYGILPAKGDTMASCWTGMAGYSWYVSLVSYAPDDTSQLPSWGEGSNGHPQTLYSYDNGFLLANDYSGTLAYSFDNFALLGKAPNLFNNGQPSYEFDCSLDNHFIASYLDSVCFFDPTNSDSITMPRIAGVTLPHNSILSIASYGNYILSGAESNGGELLVHELDQDGELSLVSVLPGIEAKGIVVSGDNAFCLCPEKLAAVNISDPENPSIRHEITDFNGTLIDFDFEDSLIFVVTDRAYNILHYDNATGFAVRSTIDLPGAAITSVVQYHLSYVLKGSVGTVLKINPGYGRQPYVMREYRLPHDNYVNMDLGRPGLWASGDAGLDKLGLWALEPIGFYGPEYFSDARQVAFSGDTVYVADGIGGIKIYNSDSPSGGDSLHFIGGYSTGNVVNQVATIGNNIFASDYYSLQHLRWGAPTGIDEHIIPNQPRDFSLSQNYPNPFNSSTTISYNLLSAAKTTLSIFDITGRQVRHFNISGAQHQIIWDGANQSGLPVSSGIYFYTIDGQSRNAKKMTLLR
jgi:hypothetical protein